MYHSIIMQDHEHTIAKCFYEIAYFEIIVTAACFIFGQITVNQEHTHWVLLEHGSAYEKKPASSSVLSHYVFVL